MLWPASLLVAGMVLLWPRRCRLIASHFAFLLVLPRLRIVEVSLLDVWAYSVVQIPYVAVVSRGIAISVHCEWQENGIPVRVQHHEERRKATSRPDDVPRADQRARICEEVRLDLVGLVRVFNLESVSALPILLDMLCAFAPAVRSYENLLDAVILHTPLDGVVIKAASRLNVARVVIRAIAPCIATSNVYHQGLVRRMLELLRTRREVLTEVGGQVLVHDPRPV